MGAVVLDDAASSLLISAFYLYVGETRDEAQRLCGLWCVFWVVSLAPEHCCLEVCIPEGESWYFSMYGGGCVTHFHGSCVHFIPGFQHVHTYVFNSLFTL